MATLSSCKFSGIPEYKLRAQYCLIWKCAKCNNYHNWWIDTCDLSNVKFKCKSISCNHSNQVDYKITEDSEFVKCTVHPYKPSDLQAFFDWVPYKATIENLKKIEDRLSYYNITPEIALDTWCVHDAIHYIGEFGFDLESEGYVRHIEEVLNVGWYSLDPRLNSTPTKECDVSRFTHQQIQDVAEQIKGLLDGATLRTGTRILSF
jgi:hypothetical protein